jgi:hypothetical protein
MADIIEFPPRGPEDSPLSDEAILACVLAGRHLLNAMRSIGIEPSEIETQNDALQKVWPTKWGYDSWCAWHACRIILRRAGWDIDDIAIDRRHGWRTSASYVEGKAIVGPV